MKAKFYVTQALAHKQIFLLDKELIDYFLLQLKTHKLKKNKWIKRISLYLKTLSEVVYTTVLIPYWLAVNYK